MQQHFQIIGTGLHLPRCVVTAEDADQRAGLPGGWTREHIGVLTRYECLPPETLGSMARAAIVKALTDAHVGWKDIDLIIDGSTSRHQLIPCNAALVQSEFVKEANGIPAFDIQSTCLGFVLALHTANALFASGAYRHILIVCSEGGMRGVNWQEPESACLVGDGAAAAVVRRNDNGAECHFAHETHARHLDTCHIRGGGHSMPSSNYNADTDPLFRFHMDGPRLFRVACKLLPKMTNRLIADSGLAKDELHVVPHQASPRALEIIRRLLRVRQERFHDRVAEIGNMAAASIPAVLHLLRREAIVGAGDSVLLLGTSAGYSQATLIFRM